MFWFLHLERLLCQFIVVEQRRVLLKGLSHRQDMGVRVALTVNSRYKVLKGTAVKRESSGPLSLLVLLNGLQDELLLKRGNWHY